MFHFSILLMTTLTITSTSDHLIKLVDNHNQPLPHYSVTMMIDDQPVPAKTLSDGQLLLETNEVIINGETFTLDKEQETIVVSDIPDEPLSIAEQQSETFIQVIDQHNEPLSSYLLLLDGEEVLTDEEGHLTLELTPGSHELSHGEEHMMVTAGEERYFTIQAESDQPAASSSVSSSEEVSTQQRAPERIAAAGLVIQKPTHKPIHKPIRKTIQTPQSPVLHPQPKPQQHKTLKQHTKKTAAKKTKTQKKHITISQKPVKSHVKKEKIIKEARPKQNHPKTAGVPYEVTQKAIKKTPIRKISVKPQLPVTEPQVDPRPRVSTEETVPKKPIRAKKKKTAQLPQTGEHDITRLLSSIFAVSGASLLIFSQRSFRT
ncbi:hypothetical protein [Macrococcus brunensis]|uniref:hypothetical protein n=1 Tax=Macrococcus brunensis TaxID=198483 RepID=UPI001EF113F3|nr:hypothetical protein [Macrococcus brunensis]ULG71593.1 hypothetical protein MGG12_09840 [Macrococcus brunensis]ULG73856.1 hypothetical protein MGG13_09360 [Macrococcus brunensis]